MFAGIYPVDNAELNALKNALEKLTLNDASVTIMPDSRYILYFHYAKICQLYDCPSAHMDYIVIY